MRFAGRDVSDADLERFRSKLIPANDGSGCILWGGGKMWKGYGIFSLKGHPVRAHRFSYALSSHLTDEQSLDHLCRNRACVNPAHLEPVTARQNVLRSPIAPARINADKTHCPKGHPYAGQNLFVRANGIRECRECGRQETRAYIARNREKVNAKKRERRLARRTTQ